MPDLTDSVIEELRVRLGIYIESKPQLSAPAFVGCGGSAAIFKMNDGAGFTAVKVYRPDLFARQGGSSEQRRLRLQEGLIGHECENLVSIQFVEEALGTAFIGMEFIDWPTLKSVVGLVPDSAIVPLLRQLVIAVRFLDSKNIVHRDIKPENIHVSPDFTKLKLIDLGVARELSRESEESESATDYGGAKRFIATAQYSSPEYLFRLDEPTDLLWKGLSIYQIGGVLHDLIVKEPLFGEYVKLGNRWLLARAVLQEVPALQRGDPLHLTQLKGLAMRCLTKDLDTRLKQVDWGDFELEAPADEAERLRSRLVKRSGSGFGPQSVQEQARRLDFSRRRFFANIVDGVRTKMISVCSKDLPLKLRLLEEDPFEALFEYDLNGASKVLCLLVLKRDAEMQERNAQVLLGAGLMTAPFGGDCRPSVEPFLVTSLERDLELVVQSIVERMSGFIGCGLDLSEASPDIGVGRMVDLRKL